jgi:hypothetical protein
VTSEVFTAVNMKNVVFWDISPCGSCRNRRFVRTYRLYPPGENIQRTKNTLARASDCSTLRSIVAIANMFLVLCFHPDDGGGGIFSSETSIPTRTSRRHIPEDDILTNHVHFNCESITFISYHFVFLYSIPLTYTIILYSV